MKDEALFGKTSGGIIVKEQVLEIEGGVKLDLSPIDMKDIQVLQDLSRLNMYEAVIKGLDQKQWEFRFADPTKVERHQQVGFRVVNPTTIGKKVWDEIKTEHKHSEGYVSFNGLILMFRPIEVTKLRQKTKGEQIASRSMAVGKKAKKKMQEGALGEVSEYTEDGSTKDDDEKE